MSNQFKHIFGLTKVDYFFIFILFSVTFYIRYAAFTTTPLDLFSDDAIYMSMARAFSEGNFERILHPHWQPLYPLMGVIFHFFISDWALVARFVSIVFGSLLIIPIYLLVKFITNRFISAAVILYLALFSPLIESSTNPLTGSLFTFILWLTLLFLWKAVGFRSKKFAFFGGTAAGLALLTRSEGIFLPFSFIMFYFFYILILVFNTHLRKRIVRDKVFLHATIKILLMVLILLLYISTVLAMKNNMLFVIGLINVGFVYLISLSLLSFIYVSVAVIHYNVFVKVYEQVRPLVIIIMLFMIGVMAIYFPYKFALNKKFFGVPFFEKAINLQLRSGNAFEFNADQSSTWAQDFWGVRTADPHAKVLESSTKKYNFFLIYDIYLTNAFKRMTIFIGDYIFKYSNFLEWILLIPGIIWLIKNPQRRTQLLFLFSTLAIIFIGIAVFAPAANERYIYWLTPAFPIMAIVGIYGLYDFGLLKPTYRAVAVFLLLFYFFARSDSFFYPFFLPIDNSARKENYITDIDYWFMKNNPKNRVMAIHEGVGFYSRSQVIYTPMAKNLPELLDYAKKWQVLYIVAHSRETTRWVEFLFDEGNNSPIYSRTKAVIYRVL